MKKKVMTLDGVKTVEVIDEFVMFGQTFFTYYQEQEDSVCAVDTYSGYSVYKIYWIECGYFLDLKELSLITMRRAKERLKQKKDELFELRYSCLLEEIGSTNPINEDYENAKNNV